MASSGFSPTDPCHSWAQDSRPGCSAPGGCTMVPGKLWNHWIDGAGAAAKGKDALHLSRGAVRTLLSPCALPQLYGDTSGASVGIPRGILRGNAGEAEAAGAAGRAGCLHFSGAVLSLSGDRSRPSRRGGASSRGLPRGAGQCWSRTQPSCPLPSCLHRVAMLPWAPEPGPPRSLPPAEPPSPGPAPRAPRAAGDSPGTATCGNRCCWPTLPPPAWCLFSVMGRSLPLSALWGGFWCRPWSCSPLSVPVSPGFHLHTLAGRCP